MVKDLQKLILRVKDYNPKADCQKIEKAFNFAFMAHRGQKRLSGKPVFIHPFTTAFTLADWKLDTDSIVAGLLHDVVEDTDKSLEEVALEFGEEVAMVVDGVTKISAIKLQANKEEEFVENLRKMILVMAKDLRVVLVKLADRYHNMQTLSFLPKEKQKRIARETLDVYAPLAERLGIGEMKGKLEDLAFPYCYPEDYAWIKNLSAPYYRKSQRTIENMKDSLVNVLVREKMEVCVNGRTKHLYSLWRKILRSEIDQEINRIYDLAALRVIVESVEDCYAALGIIHKSWKPVPAVGVRDFIAQPKPNGYRSIHTTVFGPNKTIVEIQIRTSQMHEEAENGIAAHWYYSLQKNKSTVDYGRIEKGFFAPDTRLSWVRQLVAWHKEIVDSQEFLEALKIDALNHRIFVFSPKGDVYDLPLNATPVDFAYAIHTQLGHRTRGSRVDGRIVSLNTKLKSGQLVEILLGKENKKPSYGWLGFVSTRKAKDEIKRRLKTDTKSV